MAGRPDKQNADYFSHDNDMRNDKKLKAVRARFDLRGYAVYNMILESLAEADLLMIRNTDLEIEMLAGDFGIESEELSKLLEYFQKIKLLKITPNLISCPQLDSRLKPIFDKRNRDLLQLRENFCRINSIDVAEIGISDAEIHIVKKSKVNERKEKSNVFYNVPLPKNLDNEECIKSLEDFFIFRAEALYKPLQSIPQIEIFFKELNGISGGNPDVAVKILEKSMRAGYADIFPLKSDNNQTSPTISNKKIKIAECPHCEKIDEYRILSESKKGIIAGCNNCKKEFEVKNE